MRLQFCCLCCHWYFIVFIYLLIDWLNASNNKGGVLFWTRKYTRPTEIRASRIALCAHRTFFNTNQMWNRSVTGSQPSNLNPELKCSNEAISIEAFRLAFSQAISNQTILFPSWYRNLIRSKRGPVCTQYKALIVSYAMEKYIGAIKLFFEILICNFLFWDYYFKEN